MPIYIIFISLILYSQTIFAEDKKSDLPDFSLYEDNSTQDKKSDQKAREETSANIPTIKDQDLSVKQEELPDYVKEMLNNNKELDINAIANSEAKKRQLEELEKADKEKKEQLERERIEREKTEADALNLKLKEEEERERQIKLMEQQYRIFSHRPNYDPKQISKTDQVHKEKYGYNNTHLAPFIPLDQYTRYMFLMAMEEKTSEMKALINRGAKINARDEKNHYTPLMYSVFHGKHNSVEWLLKNGADLEIIDINGRTALHIAAIRKDWVSMEKLIKMKPSTEKIDFYKKRPMYYSDGIGKDLASIAVDLYDDKNLALLDFVESNNPYGIKEAVANGADINTKNEDGNTPLHIAIEKRSANLVSIILSYNPDISAKNKLDEDPIALSQKLNDEYIWSILKTHISKINMNTNNSVLQFDKKPKSLLP